MLSECKCRNGTADYVPFVNDDVARYSALVKRLGIQTQ